jgi:uncharacterized membrane protein YbhN (UPF0104 family)
MSFILSKGFYKVISLFIKVIILLLSFGYIYYKLSKHDFTFLNESFKSVEQQLLLFACIVLMIVNWSIEALKWKKIIAVAEHITFIQSLKSIFAGVTMSIFTPNRVGEFAGRIFYLKQADKLQAIFISFIGSAAQLIITIIAGIIAISVSSSYNIHATDIISGSRIFIFLGVTIITCIFLFITYTKKQHIPFLIKLNSAIAAVGKKKFALILILSAIRYVVFSIQYYLLLRLFKIQAGIEVSFILIALVFFIFSAIPTFALTEIVVRSATAVYFFGLVTYQTDAIISSSLLLWLINIAVPAIIGSFFIWELKFFKE